MGIAAIALESVQDFSFELVDNEYLEGRPDRHLLHRRVHMVHIDANVRVNISLSPCLDTQVDVLTSRAGPYNVLS